MRVCVFGAGAVGGHIAARFLAAGLEETSVVARGASLSAIQQRGLTLRVTGKEFFGRPCLATDSPETLPPQDVVIVCLKAQALPGAAEAIHRLLKKNGVVLFVVNGIPWWWRYGLPGPQEPLQLLDPEGVLWQLLKERSLGCVCNSSNEVIEPGIVEGMTGDSWYLGDPISAASSRLTDMVALFQQAGFDASGSADLRRDIWKKLLLNASLNTLSALTRLPTIHLTTDQNMRVQMMDVMFEVMAVAKSSGWDLQSTVDVEALIAPERRVHSHRTSMLQDVLAGRSLETVALLGQLVEFAREAGVRTPLCDILLSLLRGFGLSGGPEAGSMYASAKPLLAKPSGSSTS